MLPSKIWKNRPFEVYRSTQMDVMVSVASDFYKALVEMRSNSYPTVTVIGFERSPLCFRG